MNLEVPQINQNQREWARTFEKYDGQYIRHQVSLMRAFLENDKNKIEEDWINDGYSEIYVSLIIDPGFSGHKRLQGDIDNITFEDVKYYYLYSKLLEE